MSTLSQRRWRSATWSMIGLTVVGAFSATYFQSVVMQKRGNVMSNSNYLSDTITKVEEPGISAEALQAEVDMMLQKAQEQNKNYKMVRIDRPPDNDAAPRRFDSVKD